MGYLIKLVTPPGGTVLDPFVGSGSTGVAAIHHGYRFIGLDDDPRAIAIARHRIAFWGAEVEVLGPIADDSELKGAK